MTKYQYMKIPLKYFNPQICTKYDIHNLAHNGYVRIEIRKGIYGLNEAGILACNYIVNHLVPFGYYLVTHTLDLWTHETIPTSFILCVDNFGMKSYNK